VERGEVITSEMKLMERWGWSKTKVRSFLKLMIDDKILITKKDHKKTAIKIVGYELYQDIQTTEDTSKRPQKDHKKTTKRPQKDTINNDNNENNENNDNKIQYPEWLPVKNFEKYVENRKKIKHPMTEYAIELTIKKLQDFYNQGHDIAMMLDQASVRGYRDVFPVDKAYLAEVKRQAGVSDFEQECWIAENGKAIWKKKEPGTYKMVGMKDKQPVYEKIGG